MELACSPLDNVESLNTLLRKCLSKLWMLLAEGDRGGEGSCCCYQHLFFCCPASCPTTHSWEAKLEGSRVCSQYRKKGSPIQLDFAFCKKHRTCPTCIHFHHFVTVTHFVAVTCQSRREQASAFGAANEGIKSRERRKRRKSTRMPVGPFCGHLASSTLPFRNLQTSKPTMLIRPVAPSNKLERPQA